MNVTCPGCGTANSTISAICSNCRRGLVSVGALEASDQRTGTTTGSVLVVVLCSIYLLNFFAGLDFVPDIIPVIGNLDDVGAVYLLMRSLSNLGWINLSGRQLPGA